MRTLRNALVIIGIRWSLISSFMRLRISQVAAIIPAAGYALLWSDFAEKSLTYQWRLQDGAWFTVQERLTLVYVGSLMLTVALVIFVLRCPRIIRRNPAVEDAILEYEQTADQATRRTVVETCKSFYVDEPHAKFSQTVGPLVRLNLSAQEIRQARSERPKIEPRTLVRAFYLHHESTRFGSLLLTTLLVGYGTALLFAPAAEVFYLVIRMLLNRASA